MPGAYVQVEGSRSRSCDPGRRDHIVISQFDDRTSPQRRFSMGNSNSADLLQLPLHEQKPFRATDCSNVTKTPTSVTVQLATFHSSASITDNTSNLLMYEIKGLGMKRTLVSPDGKALLTLKRSAISHQSRVCWGGDTGNELFSINLLLRFSRILVSAEFVDKETDVPCRLVLDGRFDAKTAVVYFERGSPTLSVLERVNDFTQHKSRYQAVGRVQRVHSGDYSVEAAPGVDLTVLVMMWAALPLAN